MFFLSFRDFWIYCSVSSMILRCWSSDEPLSRKSLISCIVLWTWDSLSGWMWLNRILGRESSWIPCGVADTSRPEVSTVSSWGIQASSTGAALWWLISDRFWKLSIYTINLCSNPIIDASHQTHWATKICWVLLAYTITFSRAYIITSLSFPKVTVICWISTSKVRGCRYTKLVDSRYRYNRYRYHKNAIINKDVSPLVGRYLFACFSPPSPFLGTIWSLYSLLKPSSDYDKIAHTSHVTLRLTFKECALTEVTTNPQGYCDYA